MRIDLDQARHFLYAFSENQHTFQLIPEGSRANQERPTILHETDLKKLATYNERGFGIFLMINEGDGKGRKNENVVAVRAYFADFDHNDLPDAWPLTPSLIVQTSPGRHHAYWLLERPIRQENAQFNRLQRQIAECVGSEPNDALGLCRVMRVPGFCHVKRAPFLSHIVSPEMGDTLKKYAIEEIERHFGLHRSKQKGVRLGIDYMLNKSIKAISNSVEGQRNNTLNAYAFLVGRLLSSDKEQQINAKALLVKSALDSGLPYGEAKRTVDRAVRDGEKKRNSLADVQKDSASQTLIRILQEQGAEFWHDDNYHYISLDLNGVLVNYRTTSSDAGHLCRHIYFKETGKSIIGTALKEALDLISAIAKFSGRQMESAIRVHHNDGTTYVDLSNNSGQLIKISNAGVDLIYSRESPARFLQPRALRGLPLPDMGGQFDGLRTLLNVDQRGFIVAISWMLSALSGIAPHPLLVLSGEQGSGKSTVATVLRGIIDPSYADRRRLPRSEHDLFIAAQHSHVISLENVSNISESMSDTLCLLSTGGVFATRQLYSDSEEILMRAKRPIILNGIPDIISRPDLADRSLFIYLRPIVPENRIPEKEFYERFTEIKPAVLGALCRALQYGLAHLHQTAISPQPRMLDFARLVVASEPELPWASGEFIRTYSDMRSDSASGIVEGSLVGQAVRKLVDSSGKPWVGSVQSLLLVLEQLLFEGQGQRPAAWPITARQLGNDLRRLIPPLRDLGYQVEFLGRGTGGARQCRVCKVR